jgi:ClpP class serine protease
VTLRYKPQGLLAIDPKALSLELPKPPPRPENKLRGTVCIVSVRGPLDQHAGGWPDSYDELLERMTAACESTAKTIVLKIDSPGGAALGCFEAAREMRAKCAAAGKRLVSYVDGQACSAAYALACAASLVVVPESGFVGSIGVLDVRLDTRVRDAAMGELVTVVSSGARKADGNPHTGLTEAELVELQARVNSLAGLFYTLCSDMRGKSTEHYASLEARVFHGVSAVQAGLADRVQSFENLLAELASPDGGNRMPMSDARAALQQVAEGSDEKEAAAARRALAAMDQDEESPAAETEEEAPAAETEEETPAAEGDEPPGDEEDEEPKPAARGGVSARAAGAIADTANTLAGRVAKLERANEAVERTRFLASRPDLSKELVDVLRTTPLAEVKRIVNAMPKPKVPKAVASGAGVQPTRGEGQGDGKTSRLPPAEKAALDLQMGLVAQTPGVVREAHKLTLGVLVPSSSGNAAGKGV